MIAAYFVIGALLISFLWGMHVESGNTDHIEMFCLYLFCGLAWPGYLVLFVIERLQR